MPRLATRVVLGDAVKEELVKITKQHTAEQRVVLRAKIVLQAAEGHSNRKIANGLKVNVDTVRLWRDRWAAFQEIDFEALSLEDRLTDVPAKWQAFVDRLLNNVVKSRLSADEPPKESGRPISHWTGRTRADELVLRGIVSQISLSSSGPLVKKKGAETSFISLLVFSRSRPPA